jgi:YidC/Oxa1 family membrane protein insertase
VTLHWIYIGISQILLFWHSVWDFLSGKTFLATDWDWILAIIFLVITIRVILFPIFVKQIKTQRTMQALSPKIKELQAKHKGDRETLQREMMELYRKEKANPLMGCLPIFLQIPVFIGLFWVLRRLDPRRIDDKTTEYGWTKAQFHDASIAELFGAPIASTFTSGDGTTKLVAGLLVIIMIVTTYMTSRQMILKTGWAEDPQQRMVQKMMLYGIPASLLFSGYLFPIGVVIYWVVQNVFSLGQQFWVLNKYPPPQLTSAGAAASSGAAKTGASKAGGKAGPGKAGGGKAPAGKAPAGRAGAGKTAEAGEPAVDGKALAPKPGAKPVNPKKGGTKAGGAKAKRPTG